MAGAADRRAAYRHGHVAEAAAMLLLLAKGYRPIARRYKTPLGEIDLDRQARAHDRLRRGEGAGLARRRAGIGRPAGGAAHRRRRRPLARPASGRGRPRPALRHGGRDAVAAAAASARRVPSGLRKGCLTASGVCVHRAARLTRVAPSEARHDMTLNVAVQMDHISEASTIAGDSTFALMLEAERRGHTLHHYTPEPPRHARRAHRGAGRAGERARPEGRPFHARRLQSLPTSPASTWCSCARTRPSTWPTSPRRIFSSASIPTRWW